MTRCLDIKGLEQQPRLCPSTFHIDSGEFVGLIGPNGAGKTTLLRAIMGISRQAKGLSSIAAHAVAQRPRHAAYLAQDRHLVWPLSVLDVVALGYRANPAHQGDGLAPARALLAHMKLEPFVAREVTTLSGGERARVLLARALAQDAPLLVADEPCAALDPAQAQAMARLLRQQSRNGKAVLASLHDLPLAARYCDRVIVMHQGRILADGPPADILTVDLMAQVFAIGFEQREGRHGKYWTVTELEEHQNG